MSVLYVILKEDEWRANQEKANTRKTTTMKSSFGL
jgi:hypothetical protein